MHWAVKAPKNMQQNADEPDLRIDCAYLVHLARSELICRRDGGLKTSHVWFSVLPICVATYLRELLGVVRTRVDPLRQRRVYNTHTTRRGVGGWGGSNRSDLIRLGVHGCLPPPVDGEPSRCGWSVACRTC